MDLRMDPKTVLADWTQEPNNVSPAVTINQFRVLVLIFQGQHIFKSKFVQPYEFAQSLGPDYIQFSSTYTAMPTESVLHPLGLGRVMAAL